MFLRRFALLLLLTLLGGAFFHFGRSLWVTAYYRFVGRRTVDEVVGKYGPMAEARLQDAFRAAHVDYPPASLAFLAFKEERRLEVWASRQRQWMLVSTYMIKGTSGKAGPKLRESDRQVPEGIYKLEGLNPNSSFHLSMKINYPNAFDLKNATADDRTTLGSDIFIHGGTSSVGCLAMGDEAIEELFVLVHRVGVGNVEVVIAPNDLRSRTAPSLSGPSWLPELYDRLRTRLSEFRIQ